MDKKIVKAVLKENNGYKNIDLKKTFVDDGDAIKMTKGDFVEGILNSRPSRNGGNFEFYAIKGAIYEDEEVSFLLYPKDHERYTKIDVGEEFYMIQKIGTYRDPKGNIKAKVEYLFEPANE